MKQIVITEGESTSLVTAPKQKKFKCPYCEERLERTKLSIHIQNKHEDLIPENHTALRVAFNAINHKTEGHCIIDQAVSDWNENKGRYERLCNNPKCHAAYKKMVADRNKNKYGTERLQTDPRYAEMVQKKALAGRKISGVYKFKDGGTINYVGTYEHKLLSFMDHVMHCQSTDIQAPGPGIPYLLDGKPHLYLPDFYYIPYNLMIEIKDGGDNPNNHPKRIEEEKKNKAKEEEVRKLQKYNYVRVVNNDFSQLLSIMALLKYQMLDTEETNPIIISHEAALLSKQPTLYFLSKSNFDEKTLMPRVPSNTSTRLGEEENKTKRVCFAPSIKNCLVALPQDGVEVGEEFYVHTPDGKYDVYKPTKKDVADSIITNEHWICEPVKIKCIGKIKLTDKYDSGKIFKCKGENFTVFDWNYKWINKIKEAAFTNNQRLYRFTVNGKGIYDELKKKMGLSKWKEFLNDEDACGWLPTPAIYTQDKNNRYESYFTELGCKIFEVKTLPICKKYLGSSIKRQVYQLQQGSQVAYMDDYQLVLPEAINSKVVIPLKESAKHSPDYSVVDKNHKQHGTKKLSDFKLVKQVKEKYDGKPVYLKWVDDEGVIVGTAEVDQEPASDGYRYFGSLKVSNKYRGYGLGTQIVLYCRDKYKTGALTVEKDNAIAIKLYEKCGYKIIDISKSTHKYPKLPTMYYMFYAPNQDKSVLKEAELTLANLKKSNNRNMLSDEELDSRYAPVFIATSTSSSKFWQNAISSVTKSNYVHATLSFEPDLSVLYSYSMDKNSFCIEYKQRRYDEEGLDIKVYAFLVTKEQKKAMEEIVADYKAHMKDSKYDYGKLYIKSPLDRLAKVRLPETTQKYKEICSSFVYNVLQVAKIKLKREGKYIVPADFAQNIIDNRCVLVYEGPSKKYNESKTKDIVNQALHYLDINESACLQESLIFSDKDLYYNKEKFESGETNLCFVVGHSGSGKSTIANTMGSQMNAEVCSLDQLVAIYKFGNKLWNYCPDFNETGSLMNSFAIDGPGKKYLKLEPKGADIMHRANPQIEKEIDQLYESFFVYIPLYARKHKNTKFIIEGLQTLGYVEPSKLMDYAVYIKGDSALVGNYRATKRDYKNGSSLLDAVKVAISPDTFSYYKNWDQKLKPFRKYFESRMTQNESFIFNDKDLYYNKKKFDSGDINICFIAGQPKSGQTTLANTMGDQRNVEIIELQILNDFVGQYVYEDDNFNSILKEIKYQYDPISNLLLTFLKEYKHFFPKKPNDYWKERRHNTEKFYEIGAEKFEQLLSKLVKLFISYSISYANTHKQSKFIIEGIQLLYYFEPEAFKDYAFYIKGTSILLSKWRKMQQDQINFAYIKADEFLFRHWKKHNDIELKLKKFRKYFESRMIQNESNDNLLYHEDGMVGAIGAALPSTPAPSPNNSNDNYYLVQYVNNNDEYSYGLTKDPLQDTLYEVEPVDKNKYKVKLTKKSDINQNESYTFKIKNRQLAEELYYELASLVHYNRPTFIDGDYDNISPYLYARLTEGSKIISPDQLKFDVRFEATQSHDEKLQSLCNNVYDYLRYGKKDIDKLQDQFESIVEFSKSLHCDIDPMILNESTISNNQSHYMIEQHFDRLLDLSIQLNATNSELQRVAIKEEMYNYGWNPELPFNRETIELLKAIGESEIDNSPKLNEIDVRNLVNYDNYSYLNESMKSNLEPIFIVLFNRVSILANSIQFATNSMYNHVELALSSALDKLYTYSTTYAGFRINSLEWWREEQKKFNQVNIKVNAYFITKPQKAKLMKRIEYYKSAPNTSFNFKNIANILINRPLLKTYNDTSLICSQFVYNMLRLVGISIDKPEELVTPGDIDKITAKNLYTVYNGPINNYDKVKTDRICNKLLVTEIKK